MPFRIAKEGALRNLHLSLRQVRRSLIFIFVISVISIIIQSIPSSSMASTYLPLDDEVYEILNHLEAEGVIESGLLTTRPLSRREVVRLIIEAERNSTGKNAFIQKLVRNLKERFKDEIGNIRFIKPVDLFYSRYIYTDSETQAVNYNNDGDNYEEGFNLRVGFTSRAELDWLSFYINPEFRYSEYDRDLIAKRGYFVLAIAGLALQLGKDSQWWGAGYHGAILLSNNAEPFTMLKITNPQPVLLPSVFKYLGPFRFTFFATRLEKERGDIPEPYLWGMRLNFKPAPYLEIGLQRTALLGGEGRSEDLKTWLKSFTGKGENEPGEAGDQRAGLDVKLTLPFKAQPLQLYAEAAGEDEAGGLPYKWAYLTGIYLPRIFSIERISLRGEYATTHVKGSPDVWYTHHIYTDGYRYKGRIIGHHMGTDSEDIFVEVSYHILESNGKIAISYDKERRNLSGTIKEKKDELGLRLETNITKDLRTGILYNYGNLRNIGNIEGDDKEFNQIRGFVRYEF